MTDINPRAAEHVEYRQAIRELCAGFPSQYWQRIEAAAAYPEEFVQALTDAGWLAALIPAEYGGGGLGVTEASVILEEINRSGANSGACHAQMYIMGTLLRHGSRGTEAALSAARSHRASCACNRSPSPSPPPARTPPRSRPSPSAAATATSSTAKRSGSRACSTPTSCCCSRAPRRWRMSRARPKGSPSFWSICASRSDTGLTLRPIANMVNHETNEVFFDNFEIPAENLIGEEGKGFRYILDGMNAERILIAAECIGDGFWFIDKARRYADERMVFDRPIGQNQGVQFPIARAYANVRAADLMRYEAARLFDAGEPCGAEANMAKLLAADASWEAANVCLQTHGGFGFAAEYDVERKFRETRLYQVAPVSTNLILSYLAEHVLGLPRSF